LEADRQGAVGTDGASQAQPAAPVAARSIAVDTPVAKPVPQRQVVSRRVFVLGGFWTSLMLAFVGLVGSPLNFVWPRKIGGFGGPIPVSADRIPGEGADPVRVVEGRFWLVNIAAGTTPNGENTPGGLLALWQKCPHLGCTVPWRPTFSWPDPTTGQLKLGWFRCPCHGSTYTDAGVRVFGPAPRSMDTMAISVAGNGDLTVDTGKRINGSPDNPDRAIRI
jgi:cytochrome b6-f complex iron-sulfur subunit